MAKRGDFQPSPDYEAIGQNSLFTLKIYHGGIMREYPVRNYSGGQFNFFDRVDGDEFGLIELKDFVGQLGYDKEKVRFWHQFGSSLHMGSRVLETDSDVYGIVEQTKWKREQEIYLEHIVDLPSVHESEPDIQPSNIEYSNLNTDFEPVIDFSFLDNVPESPKNLNASPSSQSSESKNLNASSASSSSQSSESLFYSDTEYDMDEDDREFENYVDHNVEWDGVIGKGKNVQTDDKMDGVVEEGDADNDDFESEKETSDEGSVPKLIKYNPKTDNKSPNLKLGLVFSSKKEAKEVCNECLDNSLVKL